jgi:hypothetical protein
MGKANYYADGQYNFYCDLCGRKEKSGNGVKTWDSHWVCRYHKEVRNPQDFVRGVRDSQGVPWSRPRGHYQYVPGDSQAIRDTYGNLIICSDNTPLLDVGDYLGT